MPFPLSEFETREDYTICTLLSFLGSTHMKNDHRYGRERSRTIDNYHIDNMFYEDVFYGILVVPL